MENKFSAGHGNIAMHYFRLMCLVSVLQPTMYIYTRTRFASFAVFYPLPFQPLLILSSFARLPCVYDGATVRFLLLSPLPLAAPPLFSYMPFVLTMCLRSPQC